MLKNIKLIATDLDGTILEKGQMANPHDLTVLLALQERKINLTFATGQDWIQARATALKLKIDQNLNYIICNNGAYFSPVDEYLPLFPANIDPVLVDQIFQKSLVQNWCWVAFYDKMQHVFWNGVPLTCQSLIDRGWDQLYVWDNITFEKEYTFDHVLQIMIFVPEDERGELTRWAKETGIDQKLAILPSEIESMPLYEVVALEANKGEGVTKLINYLKIQPDEIVVFGDNFNDLPMLKKFPHSVAVENAVQEAKNLAAYQTTSNLEGGVGQFIQTEIWGEK